MLHYCVIGRACLNVHNLGYYLHYSFYIFATWIFKWCFYLGRGCSQKTDDETSEVVVFTFRPSFL